MKRILYLTFYFRPDLCAGSFRNSPLAKALSDKSKNQDIEIDVYTTLPNRYATFNEECEETERYQNMTIRRIAIPGHQSGRFDQMKSFKTYFFEVLKQTKGKQYDLVFASSSRFFTSFLGYLLSKKKRSPLYLDVRDIFSETLRDLSGNAITKYGGPFFIRLLENRVYSHAAHINLISEGFKKSFQITNPDKLSFYTHGIDPVFELDPQQSQQELETEKIRVLYAGNIGDAQALHTIIPRLAKQNQDTHQFTLIGDGSAREKLQKSIEEYALKNVELKKPVQRHQLIPEYQNSHVLFLHLKDIGVFEKVLPSKIFEMAATGKPILAGAAGFAREFLENNVDGSFIFEPENVAAAQGALDQIARSGALQTSFERAAFIQANQREVIVKEMAESILTRVKK